MAEAPKLTPTEELVMDVLAARFRTGERLWAFGSGATRAVLRLEQLGYVQSMHGITDHTIRASLTGAGRAAWLSTSWVPALDTPDRSDVVTLLRTRCDELAATVRAISATQMELAETNDTTRQVLGSVHREAAAAKDRAIDADVVLNLIANVKETL